MNYSMDNKIWRVGGPLFAYLAINFAVQLAFSIGIFYMQFNEWNINAAFNGLLYAQELGEKQQLYSVAMSGVSALIAFPVFAVMLKKDYEYPVNRRRKERSFDLKRHFKGFDRTYVPMLALAGVFATIGLSRLMLMLPFDGILGDYSEVKAGYEAGSVWLQFLVLGILTPIVEEMLFRGLVYNRLKTYYEVSIAAYISALIFGIAHFNLIQGLYAFVMGIIFNLVYEKCRSIYAPVIMHVVANLTAVLTSVNPVSEWIEEHAWIRLPIALVWTAVFGLCVMSIYKKAEKADADKYGDNGLADGADNDNGNEKRENSKFDFHI